MTALFRLTAERKAASEEPIKLSLIHLFLDLFELLTICYPVEPFLVQVVAELGELNLCIYHSLFYLKLGALKVLGIIQVLNHFLQVQTFESFDRAKVRHLYFFDHSVSFVLDTNFNNDLNFS